MPRLPLLLLLLALAVPPAADADAAATWLPSRILAPAEDQRSFTGDTDPVFDTDGTLVVVTQRYHSGQATYPNYAYVRPPGGPVTPTKMSDDSSVPTHVAVDPRGGVAVAWMVGSDIKIRRRPPGGAFGPVETVPTGVEGFRVQMAIGPDGRETFALEDFYANAADDFHSRLLVFTRSGPEIALGSPQVITPNDLDSENGSVGTVDLAVGAAGAATIAYLFQASYPTSSLGTLFAARRGASEQAFAAPEPIAAASSDPERPHVGVDVAGRATLAFTSSIGGKRRARVADAPADTGSFGAPAPLSLGTDNPAHNHVDLALAPDGAAVVGFGGGGTQDQWVTRRAPSPGDPAQPPATFEAPVQIDGGHANAEPPEVAIGADGAAFAVIRSGNVFRSDLDAWRSPAPGEPFAGTRVATAAAGGDAFEYGIGSAGNAAVVYKGEDDQGDGQRTLVVVPFDKDPPTVSLSGPATLLTGEAGLFAARTFDYWGPVTATIKHDDGGTGSPHAYATAGTQRATATATDLAGFTATDTFDTRVEDRPPEPPTTLPPGGAARPRVVGPPSSGRRSPSAARVIELPSSRRCASRRRFRIRLNRLAGDRITKATIRVSGRPAKVLSGRKLAAIVDLRGLPRGRFEVRIAVTTAAGRKHTAQRRYRTCSPKKQRRAARPKGR